jgi:hypothetical protein
MQEKLQKQQEELKARLEAERKAKVITLIIHAYASKRVDGAAKTAVRVESSTLPANPTKTAYPTILKC